MAGTPATYDTNASQAEQRYKAPLQTIFDDTRQRFPSAWKKASPDTGVSHDDGEFNIRMAWAAKQAGIPCFLNGKRGNVNDLSHDILVFENPTGVQDSAGSLSGLQLIDFIRGHEEPGATFSWIDVTRVDDPPGSGQNWFFPAAASVEPINLGGGAPAHDCALGVSFFPALGLRSHDRVRYDDQLHWHRDVLKPDYARVFYYLADGPWGLVGTGHLTDRERRELLEAVIEELLEAQVKPQLTVFGTWVPEESRRNDLIGQFKQVVRPYAAHVFLVDAYNEPGAIGVPEYGYVREAGRMLADLGVPMLALASPNAIHMGVDGRDAADEEVRADVAKLMGGMPAAVNAITPHWGRRPWWPHRDLGPAAAGLFVVNDEPIGFLSSVASITEPEDFRRVYAESKAAGDKGKTLHGQPGIWQGYCDTRPNSGWRVHNEYVRWQDVPRINEIVAALHAEREGQIGPIEPPKPTPKPGRGELRSGQSLLPEQTLVSPAGHARLHYQGDGNLVVYLDGQPVWATGTDGSSTGQLVMQSDGNLVLYDAEGPIRATRTHNHFGAMVQLQDDGNFVVYADPNGSAAGTPLWASASDVFYP